jgi:SWI/SNF-related matrix-associated actin-dependent regulator 1 of chromatin subfamily A
LYQDVETKLDAAFVSTHISYCFCQAPVILSMWDRFRFMISKYPVCLFDWLMKFPGAVFDAGLKVFHFPFVQYGSFVSAVRQLKFEKIQEIPPHIVDALCNPLQPEAAFSRERVPQQLWDHLFPFQKEGVEFAVKHNGRCLIGDEMGLGKTVQAIAIARYYKDNWPVLIVCPSSLRSAWEQQVGKWLPNESAGVNLVMTSKGSLDYPINIVSVSLIEKMTEALKKKAFQVIIVDECHGLKNPTAKRTKALCPLLQKARRCILLSGTPAVSRPYELFPILNSLRPALFSNMINFGRRYCDPKSLPWGVTYLGATNTRELNALLSLVMIRRKKDEVLTQLPAKIRQKVSFGVASVLMKNNKMQRCFFMLERKR